MDDGQAEKPRSLFVLVLVVALVLLSAVSNAADMVEGEYNDICAPD